MMQCLQRRQAAAVERGKNEIQDRDGTTNPALGGKRSTAKRPWEEVVGRESLTTTER